MTPLILTSAAAPTLLGAALYILIPALIFVILGLILSRGRGAFLISGFNTFSKEEREKYDQKALCRFMGKVMFAEAGAWTVSGLGLVLGMWLFWIGFALVMTVAIAGIVYANTGNRFRK